MEDRRNVDESSCNSERRNGSKGPILDVYDDDDKTTEYTKRLRTHKKGTQYFSPDSNMTK